MLQRNSIPIAEFASYASDVADAIEGDSMRDAMEASYPHVTQAVRDNFTSSVAPDGSPWPPRTRKGDGHPLLIDTGTLLQASVGGGSGHIKTVGDRELTVGVKDASVPYAKFHQRGTSRMPARPFMGVQEKTLEQIDDVIADLGEHFF